MNYFETKKRLENLLEFRALYREFLEFPARYDYVPARIVLDKMRPRVSMVINSLIRIGQGNRMIKVEKSFGGKKVRVNMFKAIFHRKLQRRYSLDKRIPLKILDSAIASYQTRLWGQKIQLFNPVFWLFQISDYFLKIPLNLLDHFGYADRAEETVSGRVYLALGQLAIFGYFLKISGLFEFIRNDIIAVFFGF